MDENRPEVSNLLKIYSVMKGISTKKAEAEFEYKNLQDFKEQLAVLMTKTICPIAEKV